LVVNACNVSYDLTRGDQTIKPGKSPDRQLTVNNSCSKSNAIIVVHAGGIADRKTVESWFIG
jgi:hypothetical protein